MARTVVIHRNRSRSRSASSAAQARVAALDEEGSGSDSDSDSQAMFRVADDHDHDHDHDDDADVHVDGGGDGTDKGGPDAPAAVKKAKLEIFIAVQALGSGKIIRIVRTLQVRRALLSPCPAPKTTPFRSLSFFSRHVLASSARCIPRATCFILFFLGLRQSRHDG